MSIVRGQGTGTIVSLLITASLSDQFIYEYIGEVVEQKEFLRRMEQYRDEGIRHFYFMMLQREEVSLRVCNIDYTILN